MFIKKADEEYPEVAIILFIDHLKGDTEVSEFSTKEFTDKERTYVRSHLHSKPGELQSSVDNLLRNRARIVSEGRNAYLRAKRLDNYLDFYGFVAVEARYVYQWSSFLTEIEPMRERFPSTVIVDKLEIDGDEMVSTMDQIINVLSEDSPEHGQILKRCFGLQGFEPQRKHTALAREFKISEGRARQRLMDAMAMARDIYQKMR